MPTAKTDAESKITVFINPPFFFICLTIYSIINLLENIRNICYRKEKIIYNQLGHSELFKNIPTKKIQTLLSQINYSIKEYDNNEILFWEDSPCNELSIVIKGSIRIESINYSGKVFIVRQIGKNEIFGEGLIFSDKNYYPVNVIAQEMSTKVLHLKKSEILKLFQINQMISANFISILSNKMTFLNQKVRLLALSTIRQKISLYLLEKYKENMSFEIPILTSKKNIADLFAIARPSLSRELMAMKSEGIIDYDLNFFYIKDLEKLKNTLLE